MRGKESRFSSAMVFFRITPAYAGKSFATINSEAPFRDHPRLCGEKCFQSGEGQFLIGITPAYAGKSLHSMMRLSGSGDHPRLCGEKNGDTEFDCSIPGSPPPMRGKAKNF